MEIKKGDILEGIGKMKSIERFLVTGFDTKTDLVKGKIYLTSDQTLRSKIGWVNPKSFVRLFKKGDLVSYVNMTLGIVTDIIKDKIWVRMLKFQSLKEEDEKRLLGKEKVFNRDDLTLYKSKFKKGLKVKGEGYHDWILEAEIIEEGDDFIKMTILNTDHLNLNHIGKEWSGLNRFFTLIKNQ